MTSERHLEITHDRRTVPAVAWTPGRGAAPHPLVLAGHGGRGHKADAFVGAIRDELLPRGIAVAAIDAVGHGDRIEGEPSDEQIVRDLADPLTYATMAADWSAALDALLDTGEYDSNAIGYIGLSGGTLFGLPFVAADQRVAVAALGASGYQAAPMLGKAAAVFAPILRQAALRLDRPVLFHIQEEDDLFPAAGGRSLLAEFASTDKRLVTSLGTHEAVPPEALVRLCDWLAARLLAAG